MAEISEKQARACGGCRWWVPRDQIPRGADEVGEGFGECRVRAPSGGALTAYFQKKGAPVSAVVVAFPFPVCAAEDWCGEFAQRAAEEESR